MIGCGTIERRKIYTMILALFIALSVFTMSVGSALAAEDEEEEETEEDDDSNGDEYSGEDYVKDMINIKESKEEVEGGPMGSSIKTVNSYVAYGYVAAIVIVIVALILKFKTGDGKEKANAFMALLAVGLFVMAQWGVLIMCLDTIMGTGA